MGQDLYLEKFYLEEFPPRRFKGTQIDLKFFNLGCRAPAGQMAGSRARPPEIFNRRAYGGRKKLEGAVSSRFP